MSILINKCNPLSGHNQGEPLHFWIIAVVVAENEKSRVKYYKLWLN